MDSDAVYGGDVEVSLQLHVRSILHDYILEHLTIDQVQYTTSMVSQFISDSLTTIPNHEPSTLTFPVDPLDSLRTMLKLDSLEPYDETFTVDADAISYIKSQLFATKCKPKSQKIWDDMDPDDKYMEPFSPMLCRESRRKTPHIMKISTLSPASGFESESLARYCRSRNLLRVEVEDFEDDIPVDIEACLDMRFSMDSSTLATIVTMQRENPFANKPLAETKQLRGNAVEFLTRNSPDENLHYLQLLSPPLFPRRKRRREDKNALHIGPATIAEATALLHPVEVESMDLDIPKENMVLVDGWTALGAISETSTTPSLSSGSSEVDELDDIWLPTSEAEPVAPILAAESKMDVYQMPRQKRGGASLKDNPVLDRNSLSSFISKVAPKVTTTPTSDFDTSASSHPQAPPSSPSALSSMHGQPGSRFGNCIPTLTTCGKAPGPKDKVHLKSDIDRILSNVKLDRFQDVIMNEKLDEMDTMFMDVPYLPPANELVQSRARPTDMRFLMNELAVCDSTRGPARRFENVSGVKSLNLELSWRPFDYGNDKPTHEEIIGAQVPFSFEEIDALGAADKAALNELLIGLEAVARDNASRFILQDSEGDAMEEPVREVGFLLNRVERQRQKVPRYCQAICPIEQDSSELSHQDIIEAEALAILGTGDVESPCPIPRMAAWPAVDMNNTAWADNIKPSFGQLMYPNEAYLEDSFSTLDDLDALSVSRKGPGDFLSYSTHTPSDEDFAIYDDLDADKIRNRDDLTLEGIAQSNEYDSLLQTDYELGPDVPVTLVDPARFEGTDDTTSQYSPTGGPAIVSYFAMKPLAHTTRGTFPQSSAGLLCDRSSVNSSLFFAMRRGNAAHMRLFSSPSSSPSNGVEGPAETRNTITTMTREPPPSQILDDPSYLRPPSPWVSPPGPSVYMISLDTIQKRALVKNLESELCKIRTIGRASLSIADIIVDPDSAILFFPLSALPSQCDVLSSRVCKASWHFDRVAVIFEAFPTSLCYKIAPNERAIPFAYGPPVLKAIKRFRRDISLREGLGEWNQNCSIQLAFANSIQEAAILSRLIANDSMANAGCILTEEPFEGEDELGSMIGMNAFAANMILRHCTLCDFLEMSADDRRATFGSLVGCSRIEHCSAVLSMRRAQMDNLQSSPDLGPNDFSSVPS